nr:hypothetical protein [Tanacetum cinerariifolium]
MSSVLSWLWLLSASQQCQSKAADDVDNVVAKNVPTDDVADVVANDVIVDDVSDVVAHAATEPTPPSPIPSTT